MSDAHTSDANEGVDEDGDAAAFADDGAVTGEEGVRPEWDDEYIDRVAERLMYNYDLERDRRVHGERFDLYGEMVLYSQKHFLHPSVNFANHESREHLFVTRRSRVGVDDLERLVELGHAVADEWIDADEEHYATEFTFVVVADDLDDGTLAFVEGFRDRTLLKFGYFGHYEVNLVVVDPDAERLAASQEADVATAFRLWESIEPDEPGIIDLIARRFQI